MLDRTYEKLVNDVKNNKFPACGNCKCWFQIGVDKTIGCCLNAHSDFFGSTWLSAIHFGHCNSK